MPANLSEEEYYALEDELREKFARDEITLAAAADELRSRAGASRKVSARIAEILQREGLTMAIRDHRFGGEEWE